MHLFTGYGRYNSVNALLPFTVQASGQQGVLRGGVPEPGRVPRGAARSPRRPQPGDARRQLRGPRGWRQTPAAACPEKPARPAGADPAGGASSGPFSSSAPAAGARPPPARETRREPAPTRGPCPAPRAASPRPRGAAALVPGGLPHRGPGARPPLGLGRPTLGVRPAGAAPPGRTPALPPPRRGPDYSVARRFDWTSRTKRVLPAHFSSAPCSLVTYPAVPGRRLVRSVPRPRCRPAVGPSPRARRLQLPRLRHGPASFAGARPAGRPLPGSRAPLPPAAVGSPARPFPTLPPPGCSVLSWVWFWGNYIFSED